MFTNAQTRKSKVPNAGFQEPNARFERKKENGSNGSTGDYLPNHCLKSAIRSPLTNTSCEVAGVSSSFNLPAETV